jgi:hypothetical protein
MKAKVFLTAAGLLLASLWGMSYARELARPATPPKAESCSGDYGTSIFFEDSPKEAAARALKEQKLVFILHISGHFEDPKLT